MKFEIARDLWENETFSLAIERELVPAHITPTYRATMYDRDVPHYELADDGTLYRGLAQISSKGLFRSWDSWCEDHDLPGGYW
jgi:hypothetical protein